MLIFWNTVRLFSCINMKLYIFFNVGIFNLDVGVLCVKLNESVNLQMQNYVKKKM